ncbi:hypothetical protein RIF29_16974 [Crotalaria pallida]|uniref:Uncharacterized protein n=1 Tax=Crotalaria pallida TaxID=3830 RepID=A0AAN9FNB4_CROPI
MNTLTTSGSERRVRGKAVDGSRSKLFFAQIEIHRESKWQAIISVLVPSFSRSSPNSSSKPTTASSNSVLQSSSPGRLS